LIDADALFAVVKGHHDLYNGATNPTDKARRDENLQVMCDITDAPTIDAIPMEWLENRLNTLCFEAMGAGALYGDRIGELAKSINEVMKLWQEEQK
jgi:hypothetical protein